MESAIIPYSRLKEKNKWVYSAHSQLSLQIEEHINSTQFDVVTLGTLVKEIADGLHGIRHYANDGIVMFTVGNVTEYGLDLSDRKLITQEEHDRLKRSQVQRGDLLVTITGRLGSTLVYELDEPANLSAHVARVKVNEETVRPYYLTAYLNSKVGRQLIDEFSIGSIYPHINVNRLKNVRVILPPRSLQDQIAQVMQEAYGDRQKKLEEAGKLLQEIDKYVFNILNLAPERVGEETRFLKSISTIQGGRFDVEFNMGFHKFDPYVDKVLPVAAVATFPKETRDPATAPEAMFSNIDIASIDIELGEIREVSEVLGADAPSRARQVGHTGDVIISTVRPTRGATALIPESMDGFICSTGFAIVHPSDQVTSEYLHTALRLHTTLEQFGRRSAGSSYPAILDKDVKETLIPIPNKVIQLEISTEVIRRRREAKRLRSQAEAVVAAAKARVERMILGEETVE